MPENASPGRLRSTTGRAARTARAALPATVFTLGVLMVIAGCTAAADTVESPTGTEPQLSPTSTAPAPAPAPAPASDPPGTSEVPAPRADRVPIVSTTDAPVAAAAEPVSVAYERLDAELPVVPTGIESDGQMEIPEDAAVAAWYRFGATPGDGEGDTVIAAHVGSEQTPRGPLRDLIEARVDDEIAVTDADGLVHHYRVSSVQQQGKGGLDLSPYFERSGSQRLVLITCGGRWIPELSSYEDNIIVVADIAE